MCSERTHETQTKTINSTQSNTTQHNINKRNQHQASKQIPAPRVGCRSGGSCSGARIGWYYDDMNASHRGPSPQSGISWYSASGEDSSRKQGPVVGPASAVFLIWIVSHPFRPPLNGRFDKGGWTRGPFFFIIIIVFVFGFWCLFGVFWCVLMIF